jgi:hypothetical protein
MPENGLRQCQKKMEKMPLVGIEPTRGFSPQQILSLLRLPFRHSGPRLAAGTSCLASG